MIKDNLLSIGSVIVGMVTLFLCGLLAIAVALLAVLLAFFASRRRERFYTVGMLLGGVVMIFVNLQNIGILKSPAKTEVEIVYSSLRLSNQAYTMLSDEKRKAVVEILDQALNQARKVDTELLDQRLPGFATHFSLEYIEGFTLFKEGVAHSNIGKKLKGALLIDAWARWNLKNKELMERTRQCQPSLAAFIFNGD